MFYQQYLWAVVVVLLASVLKWVAVIVLLTTVVVLLVSVLSAVFVGCSGSSEGGEETRGSRLHRLDTACSMVLPTIPFLTKPYHAMPCFTITHPNLRHDRVQPNIPHRVPCVVLSITSSLVKYC